MTARIKTTALAIGALVTAGMFAGPATASAATGWDRCPAGKSCYFSDADGGGDVWTAPSPGCHNLGTMNPPFNDRISSVWNRGGGVAHLYNWTGTWTWVADVAIGQKASFYWWDGTGRNDVTDRVCID